MNTILLVLAVAFTVICMACVVMKRFRRGRKLVQRLSRLIAHDDAIRLNFKKKQRRKAA
jgi:cell division protein FtsL